jgi:hypothetical protein
VTQTFEFDGYTGTEVSVEFGGHEGEVRVTFAIPQTECSVPGTEMNLVMAYETAEALFEALKPYFTPDAEDAEPEVPENEIGR